MNTPVNTSDADGAARWPALDGVRGLAFVLVTLFHVNDYLRRPHFLADGQLGVWVFFVLSSYLLARALFARPEALRRPSTWGRYWVRRFLRIFPLFVVYVICLRYFAHVPLEKCLRVLVLERTHGVDWSLYMECRFYVVLPLLVWPVLLFRSGARYLVFLIGVTLGAAVLFPFWSDHRDWPFAGQPMRCWVGNGVFLSYLSCFLPGVIAAYLAVRKPTPGPSTGNVADAVGIVVLVALLAVPWLVPQREPGDELEYARLTHLWFPYGCLFAVWIYLLGYSQGVFARILASRPFRFLGAISYPGYLFHIFVYHYLRPYVANDGLFLLLALPLVLGVSYGLHLVVERPLYRILR